MDWCVVCMPIEENPAEDGTNKSGLAVILSNGDVEREVARVAFARKNAANPDTSFIAALQDALDRAEEAAITLNELDEAFDTIRREKTANARMKIEELFANVPGQVV